MEADWEIEIGGGAPVIEALWPGFVDLRLTPARIVEITEASAFATLGKFLLAVNGASSPLWSSKCDVWEPALAEQSDGEWASPEVAPTEASQAPGDLEADERSSLACYIDVMPRQGDLFSRWEDAESFCRAWVARMEAVELLDSRVDLIVRQAVAGEVEGFGITAYVSVMLPERPLRPDEGTAALAAALEAVEASIPQGVLPMKGAQKLQ
jgi:hypothetical protein